MAAEDGAPPPVDLTAERKVGDLVRNLIHQGSILACHDLSDGGLAVALAEMCLAGNIGATVSLPSIIPPHAFLFGEDQGRDPSHGRRTKKSWKPRQNQG